MFSTLIHKRLFHLACSERYHQHHRHNNSYSIDCFWLMKYIDYMQKVMIYFFIREGSSKWKKNMTPKPSRLSAFLVFEGVNEEVVSCSRCPNNALPEELVELSLAPNKLNGTISMYMSLLIFSFLKKQFTYLLLHHQTKVSS